MDKLAEEISRISQNLQDVQARITQAAGRAGRKPDEIRMVAISKGQSVEKLLAGYEAGIREFGENRIHEALPKIDELTDLTDISWHMVGHIQSRKAKSVVPLFDLVHSVDRTKLAHRLDRFAGNAGRELSILLECNVSGESAKSGWNLQDEDNWHTILPPFAEILNLKNLEVRGLMTMAPWVADEGILRTCFRRLHDLSVFLSANLPGNWNELSMGMTDDFEYAIEEGATLIRIGRAIFGERTPV